MFSKRLITTVILWVLPALAVLSPPVLVRRSQNPIPGRYIVTLKDEVEVDVVGASSFANKISRRSTITHEWDIIKGFAGSFTDADLEFLRTHPNVASIEEDGYLHTQSVTVTIQYNATWGLGRINSKTKLANQDPNALTYRYDYDARGGAGSDVYLIDSGILTSHPDFGDRASWGATFGGYENADGNGHGTHCAGIAVSGPYGVAKSARVIAVKAFGDDGFGHDSDIISGINWVADQIKTTGRPSVVSLGSGSTFNGFVSAINNLVSSGVTIVVPAGNLNASASDYFPASEPLAITVGASTIDDAKAYYSNYGPAIDIWAAGSDVISTWNDGGTKSNSGTSMAASHVAGFVAYLLSIDSSLTPAGVDSVIKSRSLTGVLSGIPDGTTNALLHNSFQ